MGKLRPAILEEGPPAPIRPSDDYSLGQRLASDLSRESELKPPSGATPRFLTHRNGEIRSVDCTELLRIGVVCYAAVGNE